MSHPVDDDTRTTSTARGFRASDADRQLTVMVLQDAVSRGLLTPEEGSERMAAAWAATHHEKLPPLTADLPPAAPDPGTRFARNRPRRSGDGGTGPAAGVRSGRFGGRQHGEPARTDGGWQGRARALWATALGVLSSLVAMIGGTGRRRRIRLVAATVLAVLIVVAALSIGGHVFSDGDFPRGGGRMSGGPGSGR